MPKDNLRQRIFQVIHRKPTNGWEWDRIDVALASTGSKDLRTMLGGASTLTECFQVYDQNPGTNKVAVEALQKGLSLATTPEECYEVWRRSCYGTAIQRATLDKMSKLLLRNVESATTREELRTVRCYEHRVILSDRTYEALADQKMDALLIPLLEAATTVRACEEVRARASAESSLKHEALEKKRRILNAQLEVATTVNEHWDVHEAAYCETDIRVEVLQKIEALLALELQTASTFEDYLNICAQAPDGSETRLLALKGMFDHAITVDEYAQVFRASHFASLLAAESIRKIAQLLKKQSIAA